MQTPNHPNDVAPNADEFCRIDVGRRESNYLNIGQIYLQCNPMFDKNLTVDLINPQPLNHRGTSPSLNLIYASFQRHNDEGLAKFFEGQWPAGSTRLAARRP